MRMTIFVFLMLFSTHALAGEVQVDRNKVIYDDVLSFQNFSNQNFTENKEVSFTGKLIYASSFTQETPKSSIFPKGTKGVTFVYCHLENVVIPENSLVINPDCNGTPCWTQPFKVQADGKDWILDKNGNPVKTL